MEDTRAALDGESRVMQLGSNMSEQTRESQLKEHTLCEHGTVSETCPPGVRPGGD